uniref:Uncharacterized protein n=1 Tax=Strigamia maritima TaxID=126957 RepID=T1IH68_STRMM
SELSQHGKLLFGLLLVTLCVSASFVTSSGGIKYYTVSSEFYDVLSEARAGGVDVRPKITSKSDGTYKISVTTSKGTRELNEVSKSQVDLFAKLFTDSSLTITVVSQSGSNVKISVREASGESSARSSSSSFGGGTKSFTVSNKFYDFLNEARGGGTGVTPKITSKSDGTYTISITTNKGTRKLKNISKSLVDLFTQLFTNPNLKITLVSRSGSNVEISVSGETGGSSTYSSSSSGAEDVVFKNSDLTFLIGYGKEGLEFSHFEPAVVIELLISVFADPNFRYSAKLGADGTYTLIAHNFRRHVEFHSLSAAIRTKGQQLTASSNALALITKDKNKKLVLAISLNGRASEEFKDTDIETVRYIALSTIYKNLHFKEKKSASGSITVYVKLPAIKYDYDLTIYKVYMKKVSDISKSFGGIFGNIFGWLSRLVSGVISGAASIVSGVGHFATNVVGSVLSGAGSILGSVGSGIGSVVGGVGKAVGGFFGHLFG